MKNYFLVYCATVLFVSCASSPAPRNNAAVDALTEQELFSSSAYIAARGNGKDASSAEQNALSALSRYFSSKISVNTVEKTLVTDGSSQSRLEDVTQILSNTELFAVRYTKPHLHKEAQVYETVAYINRDEAWKIYAPKVRQAADTFSALYDMGSTQKSPFKQALLLLQAREAALSSDLPKLLAFAYTLHPESADSFSAIEEKLGALPARLADAQAHSLIAIHRAADANSQANATVQAILTDLGFPIAAENESARVVCSVELAEYKTHLPAGIFFTPTITVTITEEEKTTLFSYSKTFPRIGASTEPPARLRMERTVCEALRQSLPPALKKSVE